MLNSCPRRPLVTLLLCRIRVWGFGIEQFVRSLLCLSRVCEGDHRDPQNCALPRLAAPDRYYFQKSLIEFFFYNFNSAVSMPLYEFRCLDCKKTFTLPLTLSEFEKRKYKCPRCQSKKLEEQFTSVNVVTSKKS